VANKISISAPPTTFDVEYTFYRVEAEYPVRDRHNARIRMSEDAYTLGLRVAGQSYAPPVVGMMVMGYPAVVDPSLDGVRVIMEPDPTQERDIARARVARVKRGHRVPTPKFRTVRY